MSFNQIKAANDTNQPERPPATAAFVGIDYDEGRPETFRGISVAIYDQDHKLLAEKQFGGWDAADLYANDHADKVFLLSSVDHFKADGGLSTPQPNVEEGDGK